MPYKSVKKTYDAVKRWRTKNHDKWMEQKRRYREKHKDELNQRRQTYRTSHKTVIEQYRKKRRVRVKHIILEYKAKGCSMCGEKDYRCLDLHHRNPQEKDYHISQLCNFSIKTLYSELAKCDVICSNCHRKIHLPAMLS